MEKPLKNTFGLDISNTAITAVELAYSKKGLRVVNFARIELNPGIIEDGCIIVDKEAFKEALGRLLKEGYAGPFTSKDVIISIPEEKTFSHRFCIPHENVEDEGYIKMLASDFIPVELSEAAMDYKLLDTCPDKNEVNINFVAAQKNVIDSIIDTLSEVGLRVVFVDVDKNSLMRACENKFQNSNSDYLVVNVSDGMTSFSINSQSGISYTVDSEISGNEFIEKLKPGLNVSTASEIKKIIAELAKSGDSQEKPEYKTIENVLKDSFQKMAGRLSELAMAAESQDSIKVKRIYVIGSSSRVPGLIKALQNTFPEAEIITNFQYIQLNEDTELFYAEAIGLALRALFPAEDRKEINLLPHDEKEELTKRSLTPVISKSLFAASSLFTILVLFAGVSMAKAILGYKVSEKEVQISVEKSDSPYLHQVAQETQQKTQLESQLTTILKDSIPLQNFLPAIDVYNDNGINLISASFNLTAKANDMRVRAKTSSRPDTEQLIAKLQKDAYFKQVISPLSNLAGKGERFINIDLVANLENIISGESKPKPKKPAIKTTEESPTVNNAQDSTGKTTNTSDVNTSPDAMSQADSAGTDTTKIQSPENPDTTNPSAAISANDEVKTPVIQ